MPEFQIPESKTLIFTFLFSLVIGGILIYYLLKIRNKKIIVVETNPNQPQPQKQPSSVRRYHMV